MNLTFVEERVEPEQPRPVSPGRAERRRRARRRRRIAVVLVVALALFAYLWRLDVSSWQGDETIYAAEGADIVNGRESIQSGHPPLAKVAFGLAQQVIADPLLAVRLVAALCGLAATAGLFALGRRLTGSWWIGLAVAGAWAALPHALVTDGVGLDKLDRYGRLEAVGLVFLVGALYTGWRWVESRAGPWRWAAATAVLGGLATASKVPFGLVLAGVALYGVVARSRQRRSTLPSAVGQAGAMAGVALATFAAAYLLHGGDAWRLFSDMVTSQLGHAADGHPIVVGDTVHPSASWWSNLWYTWRDDGPVLTIALSALAGLALFVPSPWRRGARYLGAAALAPAVVLAASPVALPHYRFVWLPMVITMAVLGAAALWRKRGPARYLAGAGVAALAAVALVHLGAIATPAPTGYAATADALEGAGLDEADVRVGGVSRVAERYLPEATLVVDDSYDVLILDEGFTERFPEPTLRAVADAPTSCTTEVDQLTVVLPDSDPEACAALA